jgi:hypothetical protein
MPTWTGAQYVSRGKPHPLSEFRRPRELYWPTYSTGVDGEPSDVFDIEEEEEEEEEEDENSVLNRHRRLAQAQAEITAESGDSPSTRCAFRTAMHAHGPITGYLRTQTYPQGKTLANLFKVTDSNKMQRVLAQLSFILPNLSIIQFLLPLVLLPLVP